MRGRPRTELLQVTERQRDVARLVAEGYTNEQIAATLGISLAGAKYHVSELLGRLGLERREEIAAWYREEQSPSNRIRRRMHALTAPAAWAAGSLLTASVVVAVLVVAFEGALGDSDDALSSASDPRVESREGAPGLLRIHETYWDSRTMGYRSLLTPADPRSGADLDGYDPIDVARVNPGWGTVSASPDGGLLALADRQGGVVTLIDLDEWELVATIDAELGGLGGNYRLDRVQWSPDGSRLFAWRDHCSPGFCPAGPIDELWAFDPASGASRMVAGVEFRRADMAIAPNGEQVYVLADTDHRDPATPQPAGAAVVVIDVASGDVVGRVALPDLAIGFAPGLPPFEEIDGGAMYRPALAHHGSHLYVVHADADLVTVIDLDEMAVEQVVDFREPGSQLSRLGSWLRSQFVREAQAMSAQVWERSVKVSSDGAVLFISGSYGGGEECPPGEGDGARYCRRSQPAGLTVVDTATTEVVARHPGIGAFEMTADRRWLIGSVHPYAGLAEADAPDPHLEHGALVLDGSSFETVHHLWSDEPVLDLAVSPDGRYLYATTFAPGVGPANVSDCNDDCHVIHVVDIDTGIVIAERMLGRERGIISLGGR